MSEEKEKEKEKPEKPAVDWESIAKYKAAELENYIKRNKESVQNSFNDGRQNVIMAILPFGDNIDEAIRIAKGAINDPNDAGVVAGLEVLGRKFGAIIENLGVETIPVKAGDKFDPYIHSSISAGEGTKIQEVYQKGYRFAGRVIRPATVRI
jgi:molecular chaperone GrpE